MDALELRRLHSDPVLVYKILLGFVDIIANDFFSLNLWFGLVTVHVVTTINFVRTIIVSIYANMFSLKE